MKLLEYVFDQSLFRLFDEKKNLISLPFDKSGTIHKKNKQQDVWVDPVSVDLSKWQAKDHPSD